VIFNRSLGQDGTQLGGAGRASGAGVDGSRRAALRVLSGASFLPLALLWARLARRQRTSASRAGVEAVPLPVPEGLSVHGAVAILREGDRFTALSTRCTHLGCRVRKDRPDSLVCPCHGSRFDARGEPVSGPAREPLPGLPCVRDEAAGRLLVGLPR
jgi:cytochrome b6-f complex iron-sulfur subunit